VQDPGTGRWTSQDPLGFGAGAPNLYGYVDDDSENATDRIGTLDDPALPPIDILRPPLGPVSPAPTPLPVIPSGCSGDIVQWPSNPTLLPSPPPGWDKHTSVRRAIRQAWNDEIRLGFEQRFWVLWNPSSGAITITRSGFKQKGRMKGAVHVDLPTDISPYSDTDRERDKNNALPVGLPLNGYCIIGEYHTQINGNPSPTGRDRDSKKYITVPTYIITGPGAAVPF
jgi:uncharacterized protein RhaS with RHS repeats